MSYIKSFSFLKRTFVLLSPLFLVTLASKELAFYAPVSTLSPILNDPKADKDSIINLVSSLNSQIPESVENYGALKIQKTIWGKELWAEETRPLTTFSSNTDYKFLSAEKIIQAEEEGKKYVLKKEEFESIKDKGNINVLINFSLTNNFFDSVPVTHVVPLSDLTTNSTHVYTVATTKLDGKGNERKHDLTVTKHPDRQAITFELYAKPKVQASSDSIELDRSSLVIKEFYILFNSNPPLNPESYFKISDGSDSIFGDILGTKFKKALLNKWNNKSKEPPGNSKEPTYEFNPEGEFWTSTCSDPYKVGGFIDKDLEEQEQEKQKKLQEVEKKKIKEQGRSKLEQQIESWELTPRYQHERPQRKGQYYWKDIKENGAFVPHDESTDLYNCKGVDSETKEKLKLYIDGDKRFEKETEPLIQKKLVPPSLNKEVKDSQNNGKEYPYHKIVQSSFRAWGNAHLSSNGQNLKEAGQYSEQFELANQTRHTFSIKIERKIWTEYLTEKRLAQEFDSKKKKLNESEDVSSLIEVYYPLSFSFFDPISGYLKKHSLFLKTELDLSYLYINSTYSKEVFSFDIGNENRVIGKDYQGFDPSKYPDKKKNYGLDGKLTLISGLELDKDKNLKINLTAQTNGFVNTKNPSCDLRHRLYKINGNSGISNLGKKWRCSENSDWSYREHIHIPSYLILTLEKQPEVTSFYIDRQSGVSEEQRIESKESQISPIKNLKELSSQLDTREIITTIETDESNNADVYFTDIAAYGDNREGGFPLNLDGWFNAGQQVYYWHPRRTMGKLDNVEFADLKTITLNLEGSKNSYSSFFYSNHFNTLTTICLTNKPQPQPQEGECADGNKYEETKKDQTSSELHELWGSQKVDIDVSQIKQKQQEQEAIEFKFRVTYNRADERDLKSQSKDSVDPHKFETIKDKLDNFFTKKEKDPSAGDVPNVSMLAFWYSVFLWKDESKKELHYSTQVRPIGLVKRTIENAYAHLATGAKGSAGFSISKFELKYSKNSKKD